MYSWRQKRFYFHLQIVFGEEEGKVFRDVCQEIGKNLLHVLCPYLFEKAAFPQPLLHPIRGSNEKIGSISWARHINDKSVLYGMISKDIRCIGNDAIVLRKKPCNIGINS